MRKQNIFKITALAFVLAILAVACVKESDEGTVGDSVGKTFIKFFPYPNNLNVVAFSPISESQSSVLLEVRRDVQTKSDLNKPTTVVLKFDSDTTMIWAYNDRLVREWLESDPVHNTDPADYDGAVYDRLPTEFFTTDPAVASNGTITLEFAAGEVGKVINITVPDALKFDFSKNYALAYKIESISGAGSIGKGVLDTVMCQVMAKNKYDGVYEVTANTPFLDVVNGAFTGYYPFKYALITTSLTTCKAKDITVWFDFMHPMTNAGSASGYGSFGLELKFDSNGNIVEVKNPWGNPPGNTRMPKIDPSGVNKWDPATKNIKFKYWMIQPSLVPVAPHIRTYFDETWTFKGSK